jgi:hypothetical protein
MFSSTRLERFISAGQVFAQQLALDSVLVVF